MIYLRDYIGGSSVRECYRHPLFEDKCVKVVKDKKDLPGLMREVRVSKLVAPYLGDYIVEYEDELVETDRGPGLVCGLVRNDCDGAVAPALALPSAAVLQQASLPPSSSLQLMLPAPALR